MSDMNYNRPPMTSFELDRKHRAPRTTKPIVVQDKSLDYPPTIRISWDEIQKINQEFIEKNTKTLDEKLKEL